MAQISQYPSLPTDPVGDETVVISSPSYGDGTYLLTISELTRAINVTEAQRTAIVGSLGQVVFQTDGVGEGLWVWKSTGWSAV